MAIFPKLLGNWPGPLKPNVVLRLNLVFVNRKPGLGRAFESFSANPSVSLRA